MTSTLAERVKERMNALGMKNAELARLSGVQPPTSFNWSSGKTKAIKGEPLLKAAAALKVNAIWLATGKGAKLCDGAEPVPMLATSEHLAQQERAPYHVEATDAASAAADIVRRMPPAVASEALAYLRWLADRHTPR